LKTIVITGTSRGIGLEICRILSDQGYQILSLSRNIHPDLNQLIGVTALSVDLSDLAAYSEVIRHHISQLGGVDALIHNAGALVNKPFEELTLADFQSVYEVNVFGVAQLTQLCLPFMKKGSHVVTLSSMGGVRGSAKFPGLAAYSSSKGAVITLSELLAEEYKLQGISFNVLALGAVQTEMLAEAFPGYLAPLTATEMATYVADFALHGQKFYNGKVLEVSSSTP
jgi:3-oxoacyl-[acyl-carrier protein] reductase